MTLDDDAATTREGDTPDAVEGCLARSASERAVERALHDALVPGPVLLASPA
jgi:hypothetical protein